MELYELCKTLFLDWLLFGIVEAWILCLFFNKVAGCERFSIRHILMISITNSFLTTFVVPPIFQIVLILYLSKVIKLKSKNSTKESLIFSSISILGMCIIEIPYFVLLEIIIGTELLLSSNVWSVFLYLLPAKILEIIIVLKLEKEGWL